MASLLRGWALGISDRQAKLTLDRMASKVRQAIVDRDFVYWARSLFVGAPERDYAALARDVCAYVGYHIKFCRDPVGVENLTPPIEHMRLLQASPSRVLLGDCDDAATLSAALAMAVGCPCSFRILAFRAPDAPFQHVLTVIHPARALSDVICDPTRPAQGLPPVATRTFTRRI